MTKKILSVEILKYMMSKPRTAHDFVRRFGYQRDFVKTLKKLAKRGLISYSEEYKPGIGFHLLHYIDDRKKARAYVLSGKAASDDRSLEGWAKIILGEKWNYNKRPVRKAISRSAVKREPLRHKQPSHFTYMGNMVLGGEPVPRKAIIRNR